MKDHRGEPDDDGLSRRPDPWRCKAMRVSRACTGWQLPVQWSMRTGDATMHVDIVPAQFARPARWP